MAREDSAKPPRSHDTAPRNNEDQRRPYPASKARGADIVLRKDWERWIFIGGLIAAVVLALVVRWFVG